MTRNRNQWPQWSALTVCVCSGFFENLKTHDLMLFLRSISQSINQPCHTRSFKSLKKEKALGVTCVLCFILFWANSVSQSAYKSECLSTGLTSAQSTKIKSKSECSMTCLTVAEGQAVTVIG